jgi:CheY-like chemotaxis protein
MAADGHEALELMKRQVPDVILTDLAMPGMNGMELIERVQLMHPHVPIVVVTAYGSAETESAVMRRGAFGFFLKHAAITELRGVLRRAFEARGRAWRSQSFGAMSHLAEVSAAAPARDVYPFVVGGLLHDAFNVLFPLEAFVGLVENDPGKAAQWAQRAAAGLERLKRVLRLIQEISQVYYVPGHRVGAVESVEGIVAQFATANPDVAYELAPGPDVLPVPGGIQTFLVSELLQNATRACSAAHPRRIRLTIEKCADGTTVIECADNGSGFAAETLARIHAGHLTPPERIGEGGYGLYLLNELLGRLGGTLIVKNGDDDGGARIQIQLPMDEAR